MRTQQRWGQLYEIASSQVGYFTTAQAESVLFSNQLLEHHLRSGRIQRVERGIYRLSHYPHGDYDDLIILWLWSKQCGVFSHTTALSLHQLSDFLPNHYHLTLPSSWKSRRLHVRNNVALYYDDIPKPQRDWYGCVPITNVGRTLADCKKLHLTEDLLDQAVHQAIDRGLIPRGTASHAL